MAECHQAVERESADGGGIKRGGYHMHAQLKVLGECDTLNHAATKLRPAMVNTIYETRRVALSANGISTLNARVFV